MVIKNYNRSFWIRNKREQANRIWETGIKMGVTSNQKNHPMVTRLEAMEKKKDEENK